MTSSPAKLQNRVKILKGISTVGAEWGILEWGADDRIRLFRINESGTDTSIVFDVGLTDIQWVGGNMLMLVFFVSGVKYRVQLSSALAATLAIGGIGGLLAAQAITDRSGINEWKFLLTQNRVSMRGFMGWSWSLKLAMIMTPILIVIALVWTYFMMLNAR